MLNSEVFLGIMHITSFFLAIGLASALDNGLARTPQLGWVSIPRSTEQHGLTTLVSRTHGTHLPVA